MRDLLATVRRAPRLAVVVLAACTMWLVIQNLLLLTAAALWLDGSAARALASALVKTAFFVIAGFWASPVVPPLFVGLALGVTVRALTAPRPEARHG